MDITDTVKRSLGAHMASRGHNPTDVAVLIWGRSWENLGEDKRTLERRAAARVIRRCIKDGWFRDHRIAASWAHAYEVTVPMLMFGGNRQ